MKSAANRPTRPGEDDPRLGEASGDASPDHPESPGEQTVAFRAIRDDDVVSFRTDDASAVGAEHGDENSAPDAGDGDPGDETAPADDATGTSSGEGDDGPAGDEVSPVASARDAEDGSEDAAPAPETADGSGDGTPEEAADADPGSADDAGDDDEDTGEDAGEDIGEDAEGEAAAADSGRPATDAHDAEAGDSEAGDAEAAAAGSAEDGEADPAEDGGGEDGNGPAEDGEDEAGTGDAAPGDRVRETPMPEEVSAALTGALAALRDSVADLAFGLDLPGAEEARRVQAEILAQLDDYVIPRVHMSTAPALIVVAGSTGAGKSTLLNTLANAKVSATGVRRPTTATPVLACHPDDYEWFAKGDLLGSLKRKKAPSHTSGLGELVLVATERLPQSVALLDTPDIDSVVEEHHEIARRMLDAADLWIFVTTAARYADAPAWRLLRLAKERGARLAIVLSRVPPRSREVVTKHFVRMLTEYGLGEVDRFVINESKVTDGMLPDDEVTELRLWLAELSVDDQRRTQAVQATLAGALDSFRTRVPALARHLEAQVAFRAELRGDVDAAYGRALAEIDEATRNGSLLRGEVLARWQDFAGSGDLMRTLHMRKPGRLSGKASQQGPERMGALKAAIRTGLESVVVSAAQRAAEETVTRWLNRPGAGEALTPAQTLGRPSDEFLRRAGRVVSAWQDHVVELIRTEGVTKRAVARLVSFDVESLALIFAVGLLGYGTAEVEVAGKNALPQRLLHALLGAESLRSIGAKARSDLRARIGMLFDDETARYVQALDGAGIPDESAATRLYQATYNLEVAR
ncbi:GTPase [Planomonospora sp. ID67723]|uniref:GTPase n=1 Tax=Planomonospora sp. ID67723 TaxID=2738134 RepID=UPI0027DAED33|nr:GTPase [Planomonospora sp. ID67723]